MGFFDEKVKMAEAQTTKLINDYAAAMKSNPDTSSVKTMASTGAPANSIADRAAKVHEGLFRDLIAKSDAKQVLRHPKRVRIIEQFCLSLWGNMLGEPTYQAMLAKLKQPIPKSR